MNDKFITSRRRLSQVLHEADPGARYSPANYWFMSGFQPTTSPGWPRAAI